MSTFSKLTKQRRAIAKSLALNGEQLFDWAKATNFTLQIPDAEYGSIRNQDQIQLRCKLTGKPFALLTKECIKDYLNVHEENIEKLAQYPYLFASIAPAWQNLMPKTIIKLKEHNPREFFVYMLCSKALKQIRKRHALLLKGKQYAEEESDSQEHYKWQLSIAILYDHTEYFDEETIHLVNEAMVYIEGIIGGFHSHFLPINYPSQIATQEKLEKCLQYFLTIIDEYEMDKGRFKARYQPKPNKIIQRVAEAETVQKEDIADEILLGFFLQLGEEIDITENRDLLKTAGEDSRLDMALTLAKADSGVKAKSTILKSNKDAKTFLESL